MLELQPNGLYSLAELREQLQGIVELPTFLDRLGLRDRRVFKGAVWGWEVLEAARQAKPFSEAGKAEVMAAMGTLMASASNRKSRSKTPISPAGRLSAKDIRS